MNELTRVRGVELWCSSVCVLSFLFVAGTLHTVESLAAALSQTARSRCRYPREEAGEEVDSKSNTAAPRVRVSSRRATLRVTSRALCVEE